MLHTIIGNMNKRFPNNGELLIDQFVFILNTRKTDIGINVNLST